MQAGTLNSVYEKMKKGLDLPLTKVNLGNAGRLFQLVDGADDEIYNPERENGSCISVVDSANLSSRSLSISSIISSSPLAAST